MKNFQTIDEYIASFPKKIQVILQQLRQAIKESAPDAQEAISYRIPAFKLKGYLVWFAAFKDHVGFYPRASGIAAFREKLAAYDVSKGTVRFQIDRPIPLDLVKEIVKFRVKENLRANRTK